MIYCFDIDGVICEKVGTNQEKARPVRSVIEIINDLYESGHVILIYAARGMGALKADMAKVHDTQYDIKKIN